MGFFSSFFLNKKAIYSQTTFTLLLILYFSLLSFAYVYYNDSVENYELLQLKNKHLEIYSHMQDPIISSLNLINQRVKISPQNLAKNSEVILNQSKIIIKTYTDAQYLQTTHSLYGPKFCQSYSIFLEKPGELFYNGTCVLYTN